LRLCHLNALVPKIEKTEQFFRDYTKKDKFGFVFVNVKIGDELRHLVMGLKQQCIKIWEYYRDEDEEVEIYDNKVPFPLCSSVIVHKNQLLITGGQTSTNNPTFYENASRFFVNLKQPSDKN